MTSPQSRPRMSDIAKIAGVSVATVSRALADNPRVPPEKRQEILRIAEAQGYVANLGARRLRLSRTEIIAVVIPLGHEQGQPVSDPFFLELVGHLADEVSARGYDTLLTRAPAPTAGWLKRLARSGRADGVIIVGQSDQHDALNETAAHFAPLVVWGAGQPDQAYCTVGIDNVAGAKAATRHVIERGARRVAFFGASALPEIDQRVRGYRQALHEAGLEGAPDLVLHTHLLGDLAAEAIRGQLRAGASFDAAVCATDVIAAAALRVFREVGLRVPQDVLLTGFDDISLAASANPPLTTVRQDLSVGARTMVELLFRRLAGETTDSVVMPAELIVRRSTTP